MNALVDKIAHRLSWACTLIVFLTLLGILSSLVYGAWESIRTFGWGFLTSSTWNPTEEIFGGFVPTVGTLVTASIAIFLALPISFGVSFLITDVLPQGVKMPLTVLIDLLAVIPSIIYGMWGLFVFAPSLGSDISFWLADHVGTWPMIGFLFQSPMPGINVLSASIILAIMIIPFLTSAFKSAFELVPRVLKESAYGMGCTTWEVVWHVVVPFTRTQMIGGLMLGLGRALGETMAVAFVIGNAYYLSASLLRPGNTIASAIANAFNEADSQLYTAALIHLGLILFVITSLILSLSQLLLRRMNRMYHD